MQLQIFDLQLHCKIVFEISWSFFFYCFFLISFKNFELGTGVQDLLTFLANYYSTLLCSFFIIYLPHISLLNKLGNQTNENEI